MGTQSKVTLRSFAHHCVFFSLPEIIVPDDLLEKNRGLSGFPIAVSLVSITRSAYRVGANMCTGER